MTCHCVLQSGHVYGSTKVPCRGDCGELALMFTSHFSQPLMSFMSKNPPERSDEYVLQVRGSLAQRPMRLVAEGKNRWRGVAGARGLVPGMEVVKCSDDFFQASRPKDASIRETGSNFLGRFVDGGVDRAKTTIWYVSKVLNVVRGTGIARSLKIPFMHALHAGAHGSGGHCADVV